MTTAYRDSYTIENYRMLFQREASAYRDDVCRGVKRIRDGMWVNGEEVLFYSLWPRLDLALSINSIPGSLSISLEVCHWLNSNIKNIESNLLGGLKFAWSIQFWICIFQVKFPQELVQQGYELADRGEKLMDVVFMLDDLVQFRGNLNSAGNY